MIEINQLIKRAGDKIILRGLNLSIQEGETVAILGPNGAGKSTLLKVLATLIRPTTGEIKINNMDLKKNLGDIKKVTGYLPHSSLLYDQFTPYENLILYGKLYGVKNVEAVAKDLVNEVGLSYFLHEPVKSFSRGMIQRIAIARAIIHSPKILLLDEPHTGLDQGATKILNNIIMKMKNKKTTTIMVTHDFHQAIEVCDRVIIIKNGLIADDFYIKEHSLQLLTEKYVQQVESAS